jgi:small subunit ribosomal protein S17
MAKTLTGIVSSNKSDKTIIVTVRNRKTHPIYKKQYSVSARFMAHDENNEAQVGDKVSIVETRPISARKRFTLEKIIEKPILRESDTLGVVTEAQTKPASKSKPEEEDAA